MPKKRKPYNKSTGRNYKRDYKKFQSSTKAKKDRASRNSARRTATKAGKVRKGDGKDVDHVSTNVRNNSSKNLRVRKKSANRGHGMTAPGRSKSKPRRKKT